MPFAIEMPQVKTEVEATPSAVPILGRSHDIESRVTVGVSDAVSVTADQVERPSRGTAFLAMAMRVSFRPAPGENLEQVLFSVLLRNIKDEAAPTPVAFALEPQRLSSGSFTTHKAVTFGAHLGTPTAGLTAESSDSVEANITKPFVVAAGEGESDPEWRYRRTETMELEGAHEMAMVVELDTRIASEAFISLSGSVLINRASVRAVWQLEDSIARVPLVVASAFG